MSCSTTPLTVSIGTAKPTPSNPPDSEAIWAFTPMTVPRESSSGPPELPGFIAASVWTAPSIVYPFGASMGLSVPLTMPVVTLIPTLSGLPMAMTGSPTPTLPESPSVSGSRTLSGASTFRTATSVEGSSPTTSAPSLTPLANLTETSSAPPTTCWLVTMCPCSSRTNPEPPLGPLSDEATSTLTTPGPVREYTSRTGAPATSPDALSTGGEASLIVTSCDSSSRPVIPTKIKSAVTSPPTIAATNAVSVVLRTRSSSALAYHAGRESMLLTVHPSIFHSPFSFTRLQVPSFCSTRSVSVALVRPVTVAVSPETSAVGPSINSTLSTLSNVPSKVARFGNVLCRQLSLRSWADLS